MPRRLPARSEIYALTARGLAELKGAGTSLTARELETLVLVDGLATVAQIEKSSRNASPSEVAEALQHLVDKHLIAPADEPSALESGFFSFPAPGASPVDAAHPEAERGVASLRQKGYYVRIARRATQARELPGGRPPRVLLVDDDPDLAKLIGTFFRLEGIEVRVAASRAEIMAAFRASLPDLVLLDVELPDANGFDVLARMRQHAVLKTMPVIMLTAEATREAVLRGLQSRADGYITKPFEPHSVVTAVREVLGLRTPGGDGELSPFASP
jgi:CheY-like chemotaxis protein